MYRAPGLRSLAENAARRARALVALRLLVVLRAEAALAVVGEVVVGLMLLRPLLEAVVVLTTRTP